MKVGGDESGRKKRERGARKMGEWGEGGICLRDDYARDKEKRGMYEWT